MYLNFYIDNGGDFCNMKKARSILTNNSGGRIAVVFKTKNSDQFVGFSTEKSFYYYDESYFSLVHSDMYND